MSEETEGKNGEKKTVTQGQLRVPNIKKGHNPSYPFRMMWIFLGLAALSAVFAFLTG